jgi:hypothetical protein
MVRFFSISQHERQRANAGSVVSGRGAPMGTREGSRVRTTLLKRAVVSAALVIGIGVPIAVAAAPAGADQLAAAGSDTTESVMDKILQDDAAARGNTPTINVHVPNDNTATGQLVPADSFCNDVTYNSNGGGTKIVAPQNSGEGRTALTNSYTYNGTTGTPYPNAAAYTGLPAFSHGGCIDIARESSKGNNTFENYAFGIDDVALGTLSLNAPSTLTLGQIREIWNCQVNDWSQLGGAPGLIQRILPHYGSGTRKYFIQSVLGSTEGDPGGSGTGAIFPDNGTLHGVVGGTALTCPTTIGQGSVTTAGVEENNGNEFTNSTNRLLAQQYVFPYSAAKWVQQATGVGNPSIDKRNGVRLIAQAGVNASNSALNYAPAYAVRWTGTGWLLNNGQILQGATGQRNQGGVNSAVQFSKHLTGLPGTFKPSTDVAPDIGKQIQGPGIADGTTIIAVNADGSDATISPGTLKAADGGAFSNNTVSIGWAVVSEKNPAILASNGQNNEYPGARFVYNALMVQGVSPTTSYVAARQTIGFDDTSATGNVSLLCGGDATLQGDIVDGGFLPLPAIVAGGTNTAAVTCRKL